MRTMLLPAVLLGAALLGGCATADYATFVTKTSLAVLDVDTAPVEASIAFNRTEGYVGPRFANGKVYPVTGYINAKGSALTRETQQVFAGGAAATLVLQEGQAKDPAPVVPVTPCPDGRKNPPLFFATGTSVGVRVGFAEGSALPNAFNFGYRRKEATLVPVDELCQPSVLAAHDSDGGARKAEGEAKANLGITQYFATGEAADTLARMPEVRNLFQRSAKAALTAVQAFGERERVQLRDTIDAVACASAVDDTQFETVVLVNARELGLFPEKGFDMVMQAAKGGARRVRYAELLQLRAGADDARTTTMQIHKKRVCDLKKSG